MKANRDKFQAVAVGERTHGERPTFKIGEAEIGCDETFKLLGVDIDYRLKFNEQISNICRKASQQINVLKRIGKILNFESKKTIYHAFIMSNFNFCPLIWHFCSKGNTEKLEKSILEPKSSFFKILTPHMTFYWKEPDQLPYIYHVLDF